MPLSLAAALNQIQSALENYSETAALDAQVYLAHLLGKPRAWILARPEADLPDGLQADLAQGIERLGRGEPLPYLLGNWEFYGRSFAVDPAVLIPRPETELLIEHALAWLDAHPHARQVADVGCGSGAISVTLAAERPQLQVLAVDYSLSAVKVARINASRHSLPGQIRFAQADLLAPVHARFDLITANLPYIPSGDLDGLAVAWYEPRLALDGGEDGLMLIERLLAQLPVRLARPGLALFEFDDFQAETIRAMAQAALPDAQVSVLRDLAGFQRLLRVERSFSDG